MDLAGFIADHLPRWLRPPSDGSGENLRRGREGERIAERFLKRNGYKILYRNYRAPRGGEVDLVCRDRKAGVLVFVEVKRRATAIRERPAEAVDRSKQYLIARGAMSWLGLLDRPDVVFRFDIVEVVDDEEAPVLIKDAFELPSPFYK